MIPSHLIVVTALALLVGSLPAQEKPELKTLKQRASYAIGADMGSKFKRQDIDLDPKLLAAGLADALSGKSALSDADIKQALTEFQAEFMAKMETKQKASGEANLKAGEAFLALNGKKDGVKTTASGLQYQVIKSGSGKSPVSSDTVKVHYHGTLLDGTVFDSSVDRGEPATFPLTGVIPGWIEALQLMKEGDKWKLFIPAKLAYGDRGPGGAIGPNSTLLFEVELLSIEKAN